MSPVSSDDRIFGNPDKILDLVYSLVYIIDVEVNVDDSKD